MRNSFSCDQQEFFLRFFLASGNLIEYNLSCVTWYSAKFLGKMVKGRLLGIIVASLEIPFVDIYSGKLR